MTDELDWVMLGTKIFLFLKLLFLKMNQTFSTHQVVSHQALY
jgi:hypothetical protein